MLYVDNGYSECQACRSKSRANTAKARDRRRTNYLRRQRWDGPSLVNYGLYNANITNIHRLRASTNSKIILAFLFFSVVIHDHHVSDAGVTKVPQYFFDLEEVLEMSRCTVREEIIDIRHEHPTLPSEAVYMPSCVALKRCSGCCQSELLQCLPTSIYTMRMEVVQEILLPYSASTLTLEFTQHSSCECKSLDYTRPVCVQKECKEGETWDPEGCTCVTAMDVMCVPRICEDNELLNDQTCQCQPSCQPQNCYPGEQWNSTSCSCSPVCPEVLRCPYGQTWNIRECRCEEKCPTQSCGTHQYWNPETCRCKCKPCHDHRFYHTRFSQNPQTCHCKCRWYHRLIEDCKKRGGEVNTKTCTCEDNYANRGRR